jgi:chromosomal replication initiator protein
MNKRNEAFDRVMARLKAQVGPEVFTSWFGRLKLQSASKSVVRLSVPTAFLKSWIYNKYLDQISALLSRRGA